VTYGIGNGEESPEDYSIAKVDDIRGRVQQAYDLLSVSNATDPYWKGYQQGLRDMLEQLV
jgi:hypothetical protein